jgi:CRISPR-associated protein Cas1
VSILIVYKGEKISVRNNRLVVLSEENEFEIPIEDIYSIVVDNQVTCITVPSIHKLTDAGVHILICNERHQPVSVILSQNNHYRPLNVIRKQIEMDDELKNNLWDKIIKSKIENQARVLKLCGGKTEKVEHLLEFAMEVYNGDEGNREGISAKMFFREMYGDSFVRMYDDTINAALNYGYAIIRSAFCKTLCAYGYNCVLGIHHINEYNPFNLADDLMEPLRPIVDFWVDQNSDDLIDELTKEQRSKLCDLVNNDVIIDGKKMRVRNAIDVYVRSLTTSIENEDAKYLKLPQIIKTEFYSEEDE